MTTTYFDIMAEKKFLRFLGCCAVVLAWSMMMSSSYAQQIKTPTSREAAKQQAQNKLEKMTPQQIEEEVKRRGYTLDQARALAKQAGIDLETYLKRTRSSIYKAEESAFDTAGQSVKKKTKTRGRKIAKDLEADSLLTGEEEEFAPTEEEEKIEPPETPNGIPYFGYKLFLTTPEAFQPQASGPVDREYMLGPGDIVRIIIWGGVEYSNDFEIDNDGRIVIPTVGPIVVAGQTLQEATKSLTRQLSRSFAGLTANPPNTFLDITVTELRPKRVFITGEVRKPGGYTVSSYANVFQALFAVGGPTVSGSLRDVRVIRNNKVIAHVDMYDYLTGADKTDDIRVQDNDIIFVPVRGKTVTIVGEVHRPAVFELLPKEQLIKAVAIAGGPKNTAYYERVQFERILPFDKRRRGERERAVFDVNYRQLLFGKSDYPLEDGDTVRFGPIGDLVRNMVAVTGAVVRPGSYQLEKTPKLLDLIMAADSVLQEAYLERIDIKRTYPDSHLVHLHAHLGKLLAGDQTQNLELMNWDTVTVYSINRLTAIRPLAINGHVKEPGVYPFEEGITLRDFVFRYSGLTDSIMRARAYEYRADLMRLNEDGIEYHTEPFVLRDLLEDRPGTNKLLRPGDYVYIYEIDVAREREPWIEVFGSVRRPGRYVLTTNMTILSAILQAGGYEEDAWRVQAEISRTLKTGENRDTIAVITFADLPDLKDSVSIRHELSKAAGKPFMRLEHRDRVFVRKNPEFKSQTFVIVEGEFKFPGIYALKIRNEKASDIIKRAGGPTASAYLRGGKIQRNGKRVNVDLEKLVDLPGSKFDLILSPGDTIKVPVKPNAVSVKGEVNTPGLLGFLDGSSMWDYIDRAGGLKDSSAYALVEYPNGNVKKVGLGWFGGNPDVDDGSEITVTKLPPPPPAGEGIKWGEVIKDTFALVASAVTVIALATQIK